MMIFMPCSYGSFFNFSCTVKKFNELYISLVSVKTLGRYVLKGVVLFDTKHICEIRAIIQRDLIELEQIIYISSDCRRKQLGNKVISS